MAQLNMVRSRSGFVLVRVALAGILSAFTLASTSYVINVLWLGPAHDALDVLRADDDPRRVPGLLLSSLLWGSLLACGYRWFWRGSKHSGCRDGALYGFLSCVLFTLVQSVFLYQFIRISEQLLLGDVVHYLVATTLAGALIGRIVPRTDTDQAPAT